MGGPRSRSARPFTGEAAQARCFDASRPAAMHGWGKRATKKVGPCSLVRFSRFNHDDVSERRRVTLERKPDSRNSVEERLSGNANFEVTPSKQCRRSAGPFAWSRRWCASQPSAPRDSGRRERTEAGHHPMSTYAGHPASHTLVGIIAGVGATSGRAGSIVSRSGAQVIRQEPALQERLVDPPHGKRHHVDGERAFDRRKREPAH